MELGQEILEQSSELPNHRCCSEKAISINQQMCSYILLQLWLQELNHLMANCCGHFTLNDSQTTLNLLKWHAVNQNLSKLYWTAYNQITSIYTNVHLGKSIGHEYLKLLIFQITDVFIGNPKVCICVCAVCVFVCVLAFVWFLFLDIFPLQFC